MILSRGPRAIRGLIAPGRHLRQGLCPKWHIVHTFWREPYGPWSKVLHYIGKRVPLIMFAYVWYAACWTTLGGHMASQPFCKVNRLLAVWCTRWPELIHPSIKLSQMHSNQACHIWCSRWFVTLAAVRSIFKERSSNQFSFMTLSLCWALVCFFPFFCCWLNRCQRPNACDQWIKCFTCQRE